MDPCGARLPSDIAVDVTQEIENSISNTTNLQVRVLYVDTDKMGVVHHAAYLRWFEAGRAKYMRLRGAKYAAVEEHGIQLPVVEAHLTYHKPARYDDVLNIRVWVGDLGRLQVKFDYEISMGDDILVAGYTRHASVNLGGRLTRLPAEVREALAAQESETEEAMV